MKSRARSHRSPLQRVATSCLLAWPLALGGPAPLAFAGPEGAKVVRGKVNVEKVGDTTVIHASNRSIIKFDSFDIGAGETVRFIQPNEKASVLNRISAVRPTQIDGALVANGRVYLVNRAGVYFGAGAEVNVGELVAAAGHISNADFLKGIDRFSNVTGAVENAGSIHADVVKLVGEHVANSGSISADGGWIAMVAGNDVLLGQPGSRLYVKVGSREPAEPGQPRVEQSGALSAEGGTVTLAGGDLLGIAIQHSGTTQADEILIAGGKTGQVEVSGSLDASDRTPGGVGGRIEVTGERIALRDAELDASGDAGGGEVLVGGDFQGKGRVRTADITFVDPDSRIRADALSQGDGGKVIVWADDTTGFHGLIGARGGAAGGDGGLVEVSGKRLLFFRGDVDTTASAGRTGLLLLDPVDLTIANGTGDGDADGTNTFAGDPSGVTGSVLTTDTAPVTVFESELEGLSASTNIVLQASNNLIMQDLSDNVLALPTVGPAGTVSFLGNTSFQMNAGDTIRTEGASISITGGTLALGGLSTRGASGLSNGAITVNGVNGFQVGSINAGTANVTLGSFGGSITDDGNAATRITANALSINAGGNNASVGSALAPLGTNLSGALTVSAQAGNGGIFVSEADGLSVGAINGGLVKAISLTAEVGSIVDDGVLATVVTGGDLTLTASGLGGAIGTSATPVRAALSGFLNATAPNGAGVFVTQSNAMRVGAINAGTGNAVLTTTAGSILDDGNAATRITANNLTLTAQQNVAGVTVGSSATPISTNLAGTLTVNKPSSGELAVSESNGLVVGPVNAGAGNASLTAEAGSIADDGNAATVITATNLTLTANSAGAAIGTGAAPVRVTLAGNLNASANNAGTGIFLTETNPMNIGTIDAGSAGVTLATVAGPILDDGNPSTFIRAGSLSFSSTGTGGGVADSLTPLTTHDLTSLTGTAQGAIFIEQTQGGDLSLDGITSVGLPGSATVTGVSGGVAIRNDDGFLLVNAPISTFAGLFNPTGTQRYTLPGTIALDSPDGIEFGVSSFTSSGDMLLNTNVPAPGPALATIFRRPGTSGDPAADARNLTLAATNGSITMGTGQVISVPGTLQLNAVNGTPGNPNTPPTPFVLGTVTVGDLNALAIEINAQRGAVLLRAPRNLFTQDGGEATDGGVDLVANTISLNVGATMQTQGSGPPPTFATASGVGVSNAPIGSRFGRPLGASPLAPADFVGTAGPAANRVLDLQGSASSTNGTPDAVAPVPYELSRNDGQLAQLNAEAAGLSLVWGSDLLAYLRCSQAPGDDPDAVPLDCLGYDPAQQKREPFSTAEAAAARADYRELLAVRDELRSDLGAAFEAYRAQAPDALPSGADFRRFVEENPAQADAANALHSLRALLDSLDRMVGRRAANVGEVESWQQDLLRDFTPSDMTPALLFEATGAGSGTVGSA